ncbi:hypothetical protein FH972_015247 [Carpinus fangiana]|uniref:Fanconi-associated nuclease n=1 Tax=Carpinus fangiana TaxID=176857 RepID=A0A5N6RFL6_9ROSI|nr:hypothetical protein FH972_015247 [Carpinus fangiana]
MRNELLKRKHIFGLYLICDLKVMVEFPLAGMWFHSRFYGEDGEQCGVEQLALQYYAGEGGGWQGVHTESGIWLTIFGLLMWDIIFSDVPNVFRTRFQTAPLDLETDSFYLARKSCIESHLQKIHTGMAEGILIMSWESHVGTAYVFDGVEERMEFALTNFNLLEIDNIICVDAIELWLWAFEFLFLTLLLGGGILA